MSYILWANVYCSDPNSLSLKIIAWFKEHQISYYNASLSRGLHSNILSFLLHTQLRKLYFCSLLGRVWFLVYHQFSWCQFVINSVYIMLRDGYLVFIQFPFVCNASHDFFCIKLLIPHKISQVWYCIYLFSKIYKCTYKLYAFSL